MARQSAVEGEPSAEVPVEVPVEVEGEGWRPDPARHLSILFDIFALGQRTRTLLQTAMRGCGIRPDEYAAYSVVFEAAADPALSVTATGATATMATRTGVTRAGGTVTGVTMTEMARQLGMPVTTAADYVRSMQARGHLRRHAHPGDGRAYVLRLTPAGLRAHRKASAAFDVAYRALRRELGPLDEDQVRVILQALAASADRAASGL